MGSEVKAMPTQGEVFRLSYISNLLSDRSSGSASDLAKIAAADIPNRMAEAGLSGWSVSWGPMVFKNIDLKIGGPDLVAYVANKSDTYVVAIAGTHKDSRRAQMVYDIKIKTGVDFEAWRNQSGAVASPPNTVRRPDPNKANVAEGTALGVYDLARTKTIVGPSSGTNIATYLKTLKPGSKVIYTGHSMGGALSPTLALGLLKELENINPKDVSVLPTAGPAPGNAKFVELFKNAFPAGGGFNENVINTKDTVTFAWNINIIESPKRCMQYLREVFGHISPLSPVYGPLVAFQTHVSLAQGKGMTYAFLPATSFTGTNRLPFNRPRTVLQYLMNALKVHEDDYKTYYNIQAGQLEGIAPAFPFPIDQEIDPELAEHYGESAFDKDGNYVGPKEAASVEV